MALSILPATITIQHQVYTADGGTDARGNPTGALGAAVNRKVIGFYRVGAGMQGAPDPVSLDFLDRTITDVMMLTPEPNVYQKFDRVLLNNGVDWLAYEVQNVPVSWSTGFTWQHYSSLLAGEVHVRRVQ